MTNPEELWAWYTELTALMQPGVDLDVDLLDRSDRTLPTEPDRPAPRLCVDCRERAAQAHQRCGRCRTRWARANPVAVAEARREREEALADRRRRVAELRAEGGYGPTAIAKKLGVSKAMVIADLRHLGP